MILVVIDDSEFGTILRLVERQLAARRTLPPGRTMRSSWLAAGSERRRRPPRREAAAGGERVGDHMASFVSASSLAPDTPWFVVCVIVLDDLTPGVALPIKW